MSSLSKLLATESELVFLTITSLHSLGFKDEIAIGCETKGCRKTVMSYRKPKVASVKLNVCWCAFLSFYFILDLFLVWNIHGIARQELERIRTLAISFLHMCC